MQIRPFYTIFFLILTVNLSCVKRYGCTDSLAVNYDPKAKKTDYSCLFEGSGIIYWNDDTHLYWIDMGVTHISVYVNKELVLEKTPLSKFDSNNPHDNCDDPGWVDYSIVVYNSTSSSSATFSAPIEVYDQHNERILTEVKEFDIGCGRKRISY